MSDNVIDEAVNRFLAWRLPVDFGPDCGITFDGRGKDARGYDKGWPVGTNLLTADQAREMFEHCLADGRATPPAAPFCESRSMTIPEQQMVGRALFASAKRIDAPAAPPGITFEQEARDLLARAGVKDVQSMAAESVAELTAVITRICELEIAMTARQSAAAQAGTDQKTIDVAESLNKMVDKLFTNELGSTDVMYLALMDSVTKKVQLARHNLNPDGVVWMLTQLLAAAKQEQAAENVGKLIIPGHHGIPGRH